MDPDPVLSLFKAEFFTITTPRGPRRVDEQVHLKVFYKQIFHDDDTFNPFSEIWYSIGDCGGPCLALLGGPAAVLGFLVLCARPQSFMSSVGRNSRL